MRRVPPLTSLVAVLAVTTGCSVPGASSSPAGDQSSQPTAVATQLSSSPAGSSSPAAQSLPTGSGLACAAFTTEDFTQVYGTALMRVTGANGGSKRMGVDSDCPFALSSPVGATVSVELTCGQTAQIYWDEGETENYQNLVGGPPGAVEQLDGSGLPEALLYTADGVYLQIDNESVGTTPPGLNPVSDAPVTEAMNLAYANVERERPCR
jgi:hypothetical protein